MRGHLEDVGESKPSISEASRRPGGIKTLKVREAPWPDRRQRCEWKEMPLVAMAAKGSERRKKMKTGGKREEKYPRKRKTKDYNTKVFSKKKKKKEKKKWPT